MISSFEFNYGINSIDWSNPEIYWNAIIFGAIFYIIGSINLAFIFAKVKNVNLSKVGSGNLGATNFSRVFGLKGFALIYTLEIFKGWFAYLIIFLIYTFTPVNNTELLGFSMLFLLIGSVYSIFLKFKGGKAVAAISSIMFLISWPLALACGFLQFIFLYKIRKVSIASIISILIFCLFITLVQPWMPEKILFSWSTNAITLIGIWISLFIVLYTHRKNIKEFIGKDYKNDVTDESIEKINNKMKINKKNE